MNSMTKKLPLIISASAIALAMIVALLYQGGYISELKQTVRNKDRQIAKAELSLAEEVGKNEALLERVTVLEDSMSLLSAENLQLRTKVASLKATIEKLNLIIKKHDGRVADLTTEINRLRSAGHDNDSKIKELEAERNKLLQQMEDMDHERMALMEDRKKQEAAQLETKQKLEELRTEAKVEVPDNDPAPVVFDPPVINQSPMATSDAHPVGPNVTEEMQAAIVSRQAEKLANVVSKTQVKFSSISLRNQEGGNDLKKVKQAENDWRYTFIDFDLENMDRESIMDEYFIIQIYDLDNDQVMPFNEKNMAFPDSEMGAGGFKFKYDGKPVSVRYINTQPKEGSNYEIRLKYVNKKGLTFPLANGTRRIVTAGKVAVD
jgi:hypothetical protein